MLLPSGRIGIDSANNAVYMLDESLCCCVRDGIRGGQDMLNIRCIRKPGKTMHVRAATVLPLKAEPEVSGTKNSNIESINKPLDEMVEKQSDMAGFS